MPRDWSLAFTKITVTSRVLATRVSWAIWKLTLRRLLSGMLTMSNLMGAILTQRIWTEVRYYYIFFSDFVFHFGDLRRSSTFAVPAVQENSRFTWEIYLPVGRSLPLPLLLYLFEMFCLWKRLLGVFGATGYTDFGRFLRLTGKPMVYSCSWPVYQIYAKLPVKMLLNKWTG